MIRRFLDGVQAWGTRFVTYPGDDEEILLRKKIWLIIIALFLFFSLGDFLSSLRDQLYGIAAVDLLVFFLCSLLLIIFYFHRKNIDTFGLLLQFILVALPAVKAYLSGGLLHAAGIEVVGLVGPIYALTFPRYRRAVFIFLYYLGLIIGGTLLYEYLQSPQDQVFGRDVSHVIIRFSASVSVIFLVSLIYNLQIAKLKKKEEERLKQLHLAKSKFYTNVTHEFRTPLTIVLGMADAIHDKIKHQVDNEVKMIKNNGMKLLKLVNQLLNLSKMEAGAMPVSLIRSDIIPFLKYIMESFHSIASEKNIRLHFISNLESMIIDYDPDIIEEVFINLLSNAVKFTSDGGDIYLQVEEETGKDNESPGYLLIRVRDNGIGIAGDKLPNIFERFYQADDESSRKAEGTGIGLALVKDYLSLLNGTIRVRSKPGLGTEFVLSLPITRNAPFKQVLPDDTHQGTVMSAEEIEIHVHDDTEPDEHASDALPLLLIVEDNKDVVEYLASILRGRYQITVAGNGNEGVNKAMETLPDMIICDIMMPEKDGFEVCRILKDDIRTNHIPIILLTAKADMGSKIGGLECGADAYLIKPFNKKELLVRLEKLIENRQKLKTKYGEMIYSGPKAEKPKGLNEIFIQKITSVLERNYHDENYQILQLCIDMGISRAQLHRKLIALTGHSTSDLIRRYRLNKARELLLSSDFTVAEIAYQIGFKDPNYFSKSFVKENGLAPSHFRAKNLTVKQ
jgi:signal transduction histidine kinase/DNA-binding response OmpR family regulator